MESLGKAFENIENLLHIDLVEKDVNESVWEMVDSNDYVDEANVIIIESYYVNIDMEIMEYYEKDGIFFKLYFISRVEIDNECKWNGEIYARHCNEMYSSWWYQRRKDYIWYQRSPSGKMKDNVAYTLAYVRAKITNVEAVRDEYMQYIGGQSHVKCEHHDIPLIASVDRSKECSCCDEKEFLTCPKIGCNTKICKKCFEELDVEEEYTVHHNVEEENVEIDSDFDFSGSEDEMSQESDSNNNKVLDEDLFNDYLTSSQDPDLSGDENEK